MSGNRNAGVDVPPAVEWVMVGGFVLQLNALGTKTPEDCLIQPVAVELKSYGLSEALLQEMCAAVEHASEIMRADCLDAQPDFFNVRVHLSRQAMRGASTRLNWKYFITRQIASSESDSLDGIDDPRCYIDLHVYQQ